VLNIILNGSHHFYQVVYNILVVPKYGPSSNPCQKKKTIPICKQYCFVMYASKTNCNATRHIHCMRVNIMVSLLHALFLILASSLFILQALFDLFTDM